MGLANVVTQPGQASSFNNDQYLLGQYQQDQNFADPLISSLLPSSQQGLSTAAAYDTSLLSGNRDTTLAAVQPQVSSILAQYDVTKQANATLNPRGGGRAETDAQLPYKAAGDVQKLLQTVRPEAAKNLTQVSTEQGLLGQQEQQIANQDVTSSLNYLLGKDYYTLSKKEANSQAGGLFGQGIGSILGGLLGGGGISSLFTGGGGAADAAADIAFV